MTTIAAANSASTSQPPSCSDASQHHPLEPTSGTTLLTTALARRTALAQRPFSTGSPEIDTAVLVNGGFERGCVVGVSAEEDGDEVGLVLGLRVVAGALLRDREKGEVTVLVVTPMGLGPIVGVLRGVLRGLMGGGTGMREREKERLGRVSVARVFDVFGLWEVLMEVDGLGGEEGTPEMGQRRDEDVGVAQDGHSHTSTGEHVEGAEDDAVQGREITTPPRRPRSDEPVCEQVPTLPTSTMTPPPPAHQSSEETTQDTPHQPIEMCTQDTPQCQVEPPSSRLSDPPSSLPDTPPWERETLEVDRENTAMDTVDQPRRTPPGLREEIQDSEEEDEGFASPLEAEGDGLLAARSAIPEEQEQTQPELPRHRHGLTEPASSAIESDSNNTPPAGQPREADQPSAATASVDKDWEPEDTSSPQLPLTDEQQEPEDSPWSEASPVQTPEPVQFEKVPPKPSAEEEQSKKPDIILITHMSTLLSSLFHQRDKATAHQTLQLLASHLRYMTRSPEHGGPLVMILNSTTSSDFNSAGPQQTHDRDGPPGPPPPPGGPRTPNKPIDPTLRSIFNPPPLPVSGLSYNYDTPHSRRNKPSFGLTFTQMLDMHLLCTKIPKTRADAEALYAPMSPNTGRNKKVDHVWAVEMLLDEMGVWEGAEHVSDGKPRRSREQRWGAVEVRRDGGCVRLADAFEKKIPTAPKEIVLAAGFGGRRV